MANNSPLPGYNVAPSPVTGQGPYGMVPGNIGIPPSTWQQVGAVAPGLGNTSQLTNNIMSELHGDINPQALKNMQDAAASYGVSSGMTGSNAIPGTLAFNKNLRNIGLDTLQVQRQGQQDYLSALQGIGGAQTPQGLAADIAAHNSQLNAAPDPQAAALQQQANYWAALNALRRGQGGNRGGGFDPAGGTGQYRHDPSTDGAYGFGFGTLGQQGNGQAPLTPYNNGSQYYPGTDVNGLPNLDSILGAPLPGYGQAPPNTYQGPQSSTYDPYGAYYNTGYDQSASPTIDPNMTDEDYYYQMMGGQ